MGKMPNLAEIEPKIRQWVKQNWGTWRMAQELGCTQQTVRNYLRSLDLPIDERATAQAKSKMPQGKGVGNYLDTQESEIQRLSTLGYSKRRIAREINAPHSTLRVYLKRKAA